jgi:hypothetical protein
MGGEWAHPKLLGEGQREAPLDERKGELEVAHAPVDATATRAMRRPGCTVIERLGQTQGLPGMSHALVELAALGQRQGA